jgi:hypothetical protein
MSDNKVTTSHIDDAAAAYLAEVGQRVREVTPGPWWSDESEQCWRLHGVHAVIPAQMFAGTDEVFIPEQVVNHQILKAAKRGTTMAEYWPGEADAAFITSARTDVPRLLAAVEKVLELVEPDATDDRDLDGNPEGPVVRVIRCDEIRDAIAKALTGEDGSE